MMEGDYEEGRREDGMWKGKQDNEERSDGPRVGKKELEQVGGEGKDLQECEGRNNRPLGT